MKLQDLCTYRKQLSNEFMFRAEVFNKPIWGDMGEDSAQITITSKQENWHLSFIRTQSGDPSPYEEFVCNVIDEYEKDLLDEELYDVLAMHQLLSDFDRAVASFLSLS